MEKKEEPGREVGNHTNKNYGHISAYELFNYGVDAILEQFRPCEEALRKVKIADEIWADREWKLEEKYEEKIACVQEKLYALDEEEAGNEKTADLQRRRVGLETEIQSLQGNIKQLEAEEFPLKNGQPDKQLEEDWRQSYQNLLQKYKEGDENVRRQALLFEPLESVLAQEQELAFRQVSGERDIAAGKEGMEVNASLKALEQLGDIFTEAEQENPLGALNEALGNLEHPGDQEQSAREYARNMQRIQIGGIPLSFLKQIGRGLFCFPMILVRALLLKKPLPKAFEKVTGAFLPLQDNREVDPGKERKINWILDGVSIVLNLLLIAALTGDSWIMWSIFMALMPKVVITGLLAGAGRGFWKGKQISSAVIGGIAGAVFSLLLCILLFVYPVFMLLILGNIAFFCLWLAASVVLYGADDIYHLVNRQKLEDDYGRLIEEGRMQYTARLEHCGILVSAYKTVLPQAVESEKERIRELEKELEQNKLGLQAVRKELAEQEAGLWKAYKAQAVEAVELAWKKSRQELASLQDRRRTMEADVRQIEEELARIDRDLVNRRKGLERELSSLKEEKEREWRNSRREWEEESRQTKERYESLLHSLLEQMRQDGFQHLTRDEENGAEGFDYRKAWTRLYYLATSVIGMAPYLTWYGKEQKTGHEVLTDLISDAAWIPSEYANVVPSRLITGIERCPMEAEIQEAVKAVMVDWQASISGSDDVAPTDRKDYTMNSSLPKDGFYKLCLNQVDSSWEEGDLYPAIFVYDFGNLDENHEKRQALSHFALRTLCAPVLQCWQLDSSKFHIDLMLTDHRGDYENLKAWKYYGEAGRIHQGSDIAKELGRIYQAGRRTREIVGNAGYFAKVREMAWDDESFEEYVRMVIFTNMDYSTLSGMKDEINNILDITKPDGGRSRSGVCPYFFMDLNRLQEGEQAAAQVCLDIVKNFKGNIYKLTEKNHPEDYENLFYDWKAVKREKLQDLLAGLAE